MSLSECKPSVTRKRSSHLRGPPNFSGTSSFARFNVEGNYGSGLHHFHDTSFGHNRRFLLPLCKIPRSLRIDVHTRERLAVPIVNGHARMMMLATAIFAQLRWPSLGHGQPSPAAARDDAKNRAHAARSRQAGRARTRAQGALGENSRRLSNR